MELPMNFEEKKFSMVNFLLVLSSVSSRTQGSPHSFLGEVAQ
jgi:hypothetical protein